MKTLSLNILDIVQNSIRAESEKISIRIEESAETDRYLITITDNGAGIPEELLGNVTDPFVTTRTKRRMGLGLALMKYHAELAGGGLEIESAPGHGTEVKASFGSGHLDRQPLGDIAGVIMILIASNPEIDFTYLHRTDKGEYRFNTGETKQFLETDTLNDRILLEEIKGMINENLIDLEASGIQSE